MGNVVRQLGEPRLALTKIYKNSGSFFLFFFACGFKGLSKFFLFEFFQVTIFFSTPFPIYPSIP